MTETRPQHEIAREQLFSLITEAGLTMTATHVPSTYDPKSKEFQGIKWAIEISKGGAKIVTEYTEGIGHLPSRMYKYGDRMSVEVSQNIEFCLATGHEPNPQYSRTSQRRDGFPKGKPLPPPLLADVLSCLLSDASAADYATYEDWASDLGYDADSRKGEAIYQACRNVALDLNRVIGAGMVEKMREAAQGM